ncbi:MULTISPECIES: PLP-dependent aminotransferase family protein [Rhodopseudomonas]|uniref:MocR-like pyridoxine biosynthesis transcription factor PdxR n=1 Tax=Rhodopseudomonas TaxID=1073 RepID=UPI00191BF83E|nr:MULTISPECIES: PLP-dependent aminotransferase family protein [Rhodopseudomonas]MDF3812440.1 PLP-dependent aminotransferase family protein [Rhodopseudomonas sp. BAL398]WOK19439.1 PLP-dependent aminotransferase family protein [Rhodopseudomonas sp. BAL398]
MAGLIVKGRLMDSDVAQPVKPRKPPAAGGSRSKWADFLDLVVDPGNDTPLLQQIYLGLREAILLKTLAPGSRLPSTRQLADRLGVSRTSVLAAYDRLLAEGYIEGRTGSGTYVSHDVSESVIVPVVGGGQPKEGASRRLSAAGDRYRETARRLAPPQDVPFSPGCSSVDAITIEAWRRVGSRQLRTLDRVNLAYADPIGELALRTEVAQYLRAARAVRCEPEQVIIVSGAQQAIDLCARVLLDPGDAVWVEDPGYHGARGALDGIGARMIPVPVDDSGLIVSAGIAREANARAAYITPSHQYPTGVVMSMRRRLDILAWAREHGAWIIEDDYDSEFRYVGRPLASLQGIDDGARVIYVGTLSKMLFPGARIGFAVVPRDLIDVFTGVKFVTDRQPPTLVQAMVTDFIRQGFLNGHIRRMRLHYRDARDVVVATITRQLGDLVEVEVPECGIQLAIHFKQAISDVAVARQALAQGIVVKPVSQLYLQAQPRQGLLLGYAGFDLHRLRSSAERLALIVREAHGLAGAGLSA